MQDYLKVVVAGQVDSGKSTLIGRFLYELGSLSQGAIEEIEGVCQRLKIDFEFAYFLDSFEEERNNQLTIDTTQAFCKSKKGRQFIFIDVPGHRELLKNMLCGSSYADAAILVIDALRPIEEQAKRHLFLLKFLKINHIIVVLNKMDLINFNESIFDAIKEKINAFSEKIGEKFTYFLPLSASQGENILKKSKKMAWYKGLTLAEVLNKPFKDKISCNFRFPIQDIYELSSGRLAVGEVISGRIREGEKVTILPMNTVSRVKKITIFNKKRKYAKAIESIGLAMKEVEDLKRGQIICKPPLPEIRNEILARIFCVRPLNAKEVMRFRCTTQDVSARIERIVRVWDSANLETKAVNGSLEELDVAEAVIIVDSPVIVESFHGYNRLGRFVLKVNNEIRAVGITL